MPKQHSTQKKSWREAVLSRLWSHNGSYPRGLFFALGASAAVVMAVVASLLSVSLGGRAMDGAPVVASAATLRHPLTGEVVSEAVKPAVFAVMVENSTDVRPQSGVEDAFLVYEVPVEGNITRWMALFGADQKIDEIGPVRSARPYFVEWALPWGALYAHVGGSPASLELLRELDGVTNLDEFFNAGQFWRSSRALAPHNVFTESSRLNGAWDELSEASPAYHARLFKEPAKEGNRGVAQRVTVPFGHADYDAVWAYNPETNRYVRSQSGKESAMYSGKAIEAANVAVLWTTISTIDAEGRKNIATVGDGAARFFQDGKVIEGTWRRAKQDASLRFFNSAGVQVTWNPGQTWVEVLPLGAEVSVK